MYPIVVLVNMHEGLTNISYLEDFIISWILDVTRVQCFSAKWYPTSYVRTNSKCCAFCISHKNLVQWKICYGYGMLDVFWLYWRIPSYSNYSWNIIFYVSIFLGYWKVAEYQAIWLSQTWNSIKSDQYAIFLLKLVWIACIWSIHFLHVLIRFVRQPSILPLSRLKSWIYF